MNGTSLGDGRVLVVGLDQGSSLSDLETELSRLPVEDARLAAAVAFRVDPELLGVAAEPGRILLRRQALRRTPNIPIFLVCLEKSTGRPTAFRLTEAGISPEDATVVPRIRHADLLSTLLLAGHQAFLRASPAYHFVAPSLKHTDVFLRVGDVIASRRALDALAFWLCEFLVRADAIVVDSWSVAAIPLRAMQLVGRIIPMDCLPAHPATDRESAKAVLSRAVGTLRVAEPTLVFMSSAIGGGDGVRITQLLLSELGVADRSVEWVAIYGYANSPDSPSAVLCRLGEDQVSCGAGDCTMCATSDAIAVDGSLYHLAAPIEKEIFVSDGAFAAHRSFIDRYANDVGVLRVHCDDINDGAHHALDVDVRVLLKDVVFRSAFEGALARFAEAPDVVVVPDHMAGIELGSIAASKFGKPLVAHADLRRAQLNARDVSLLTEAASVLIVDDVLKTGSRLEVFTRALREEYGRFSSVDYLVGVATPEGDAHLEGIRKALTTHASSWRATLGWIEKIILPNWGASECPWCKEYDALARVAEALAAPPGWIVGRLSRLSERTTGLVEEPFLMWPSQVARGLGAESEIGPDGLCEIGVLFAWAAALQMQRTKKDIKLRLGLGFPTIGSLAPRVLTSYSESLLRQCVLRLVRPVEWPASARGMAAPVFKTHLRSDRLALGEFLLAMSRRAFLPLMDRELLRLWRELFKLEERDLERLLGL